MRQRIGQAVKPKLLYWRRELFNGASTAKGHSRLGAVEKALGAGSVRSCPGATGAVIHLLTYSVATHRSANIHGPAKVILSLTIYKWFAVFIDTFCLIRKVVVRSR